MHNDRNAQTAVKPAGLVSDPPALLSLIDVGLVVLSVLAVLFLLFPYYSSGGYYPELKPGWYPDRPEEFYSISRFKGTIWEGSEILRQLFWLAACQAWCVYGPLWILALFQTYVGWPGFPQRSNWTRLGALGVVALIGALWFIASFQLLVATLD